MYTWEIENLIKNNNGTIDSKTYNTICKTSPQIKRVKYEAFTNFFKIWTSDRDGEMSFKIHNVC